MSYLLAQFSMVLVQARGGDSKPNPVVQSVEQQGNRGGPIRQNSRVFGIALVALAAATAGNWPANNCVTRQGLRLICHCDATMAEAAAPGLS